MEKNCGLLSNPGQLELLGIALIRIPEKALNGGFEILYKKGIGYPLIQNVFELYKKEIMAQKSKNSIIPLDDFTLFVHYFQNKEDNLVLMYMDEKEKTVNFPQLYLFTKKIENKVSLNTPLLEIIAILNSDILIPKTESIDAILILGSSGCLYYSKINENKSLIAKSELQVSGFISALYSFSQEIIKQDSGANLKEINFGNQLFHIITKNNVIFVYLVKSINPLIQRYMYLIADEFLEVYKENLKNFSGDITPFYKFENYVNQYIKI